MSLSPGATTDSGVLRPEFAARVTGIPGSAIDSSTSLLQSQSHDIVRFGMGSPAPEAIPTDAFAAIAAEVFSAGHSETYDYGPTEGEAILRQRLLEFLEDQNAKSPSPERLLITAGAMQGLDLACKLFVDPGDVVAVESPTYTNGTGVITSYGGEILEVPADESGMNIDVLTELGEERHPPKMIYVIPNFQNPTGTTLSLARREQLIEVAARWGALILEDDPYRLLRFRGRDLPSLQELAPPEVRVIGVHTFSKILAPGLRVGWVTADSEVIKRMIAAKQGVDTCTNVPMQRLIAEFMARDLLGEHVRGIRNEYRRRKEGMQRALRQRFGDLKVSWTDPDGGFFLWLTFAVGIDTQALFPIALQEGVAFIPGAVFSVGGRFGNSLRLCYASTGEERTDIGVERLRNALNRYCD